MAKARTGYYDPAEYTLVHNRHLAKLQRGFAGIVDRVSRIEVIDETGRAYSRWNCDIEPSLQDDGRTLKLFVKSLEPPLAVDAVDPSAADTGKPIQREGSSS
jgi:hypothetical protein